MSKAAGNKTAVETKPEVILASGSPRRLLLLREAGIGCAVRKTDTDEAWPPELPLYQVAIFLAKKKAQSLEAERKLGQLILAADTTVLAGDRLLEKPVDRAAAIDMLRQLSGITHEVITGVCLIGDAGEKLIEETSRVTFNKLSDADMEDYVDTMKPFDKAGAYGIQELLPASENPCNEEEREFMNRIGNPDLWKRTFDATVPSRWNFIREIKGSYFSIVGLPVHRLEFLC